MVCVELHFHDCWLDQAHLHVRLFEQFDTKGRRRWLEKEEYVFNITF